MNRIDRLRMIQQRSQYPPMQPALSVVELFLACGQDVETAALALLYGQPIISTEGAMFAADRARELLAGGHLSQSDYQFAVDRVEAALAQMVAPVVEAMASKGLL